MLEALLDRKLVDQVACVGPADEPDKLFKFVLCDTPEDVRRCARSCYYPAETSAIVRHILDHPGRYAVIGLPCLIKAFRLAMGVYPRLRERVRFLFGLACGHGYSKFFVEYEAAARGGNPHHLNKVQFRVKNPNLPASRYGFRFVSDAGTPAERSETVYPSRITGFRCFTPIACGFCDDTFAELADATFMDAWLPEYEADYRGHSIVLSRDSVVTDLIRTGQQAGELIMDDLGIDRVIESQRDLVHFKRNVTPHIGRMAASAGYRVPQRRRPLIQNRLSVRTLMELKANWLAQLQSRRLWPMSGKDVELFHTLMRPYLARAYGAAFLDRLVDRPGDLLKACGRRIERVVARGVRLVPMPQWPQRTPIMAPAVAGTEEQAARTLPVLERDGLVHADLRTLLVPPVIEVAGRRDMPGVRLPFQRDGKTHGSHNVAPAQV